MQNHLLAFFGTSGLQNPATHIYLVCRIFMRCFVKYHTKIKIYYIQQHSLALPNQSYQEGLSSESRETQVLSNYIFSLFHIIISPSNRSTASLIFILKFSLLLLPHYILHLSIILCPSGLSYYPWAVHLSSEFLKIAFLKSRILTDFSLNIFFLWVILSSYQFQNSCSP